MKHRFSLKRAILDILYIKEQVYDKFKNNENYKPILDFLMAKDYLNDDNMPLPTFKEMEEWTGFKMYHLRKNLKGLYDEIFESEDMIFEFKKVEINFWMKNYDEYASFICRGLNHIPRIGENIDVPFVKARLNCDYFYVQDVRHRFMGKTQFIDVQLKSGSYNSYWYFRRHEAEEKRELDLRDFYKLDEYVIKKKLGLIK